MAVLVVWVWLREGRPVLTWAVVIAPLLMVHYPLQHRIFDLRVSAWELRRPGYSTPFRRPISGQPVARAAFFLRCRPNSPTRSSSRRWAARDPVLALLVAKRIRRLGEESPGGGQTILRWGLRPSLRPDVLFWALDDVVIRRLSLPTHLARSPIVPVLPQITKAFAVRLVFAVAVLGCSGVSMASHAYSQNTS